MALSSSSTNSMVFREYIGAMWKGIKFTDVPINPNVNFHFILSFAIDYNADSSPPRPSNGIFKIFWDHYNLGPSQASSIKKAHPNVKVALSLGGDTVKKEHVYFDPTSVDSWVNNAVSSLTKIIKEYSLDGIDINYEHFKDGTDPGIFAECIGRLVKALKEKKVVSFASIAPFDNALVQRNYKALWSKYGQLIDYVNFQFYAYDKGTTVTKFLEYYHEQTKNYKGGKIIPSFLSDASGGLSPEGDGFFSACRELRGQGELHGIFMWCADDSKKYGFPYEKKSQAMLASNGFTVTSPSSTSTKLFREYIGAMWNGVKFTDVPINSNVDFHFILSFSIDYTDSSPHTVTDGKFNIFWNSDDLGPSQVISIKKKYENVKVALSLGGDTVGEQQKAYFNPTSIDSWVKNAVSTLTKIIRDYSLDGIDINYQHFNAGSDPHIFAECIGRLLKALKQSRVISFASIAPFDDDQVQSHYKALWSKYAQVIDYVNFQFYAPDEKASKSQFLEYYHLQSSIYAGGKIVISLLSNGGGLSPKNGFFTACRELRKQGKFHGIFIWCADDSKEKHKLQGKRFHYEEESQAMLASAE